MSTTEAENKEVASRVLEEVWNEGNLDLVDELISDDIVLHTNAVPEPVRGPDEFKEFVSLNRTAFPDFDLTVDDVFAKGDKVVQRGRTTGTHEGEFLGVEPTGVEIENQWIGITRIEDGQPVEGWLQVDAMGLMQQLGVVEPPGQ